MHPRLAALQKRLGTEKKAPAAEPVGDAGLGDAIKALVKSQVEEAMAAQQAQEKADHKMRKIFEHEPEPAAPGPQAPTPAGPGPAPPPPPRPLDMQIHRDGAGLARTVTVGGQLYRIHRTAEGYISKLTPDEGATK